MAGIRDDSSSLAEALENDRSDLFLSLLTQLARPDDEDMEKAREETAVALGLKVASKISAAQPKLCRSSQARRRTSSTRPRSRGHSTTAVPRNASSRCRCAGGRVEGALTH